MCVFHCYLFEIVCSFCVSWFTAAYFPFGRSHTIKKKDKHSHIHIHFQFFFLSVFFTLFSFKFSLITTITSAWLTPTCDWAINSNLSSNSQYGLSFVRNEGKNPNNVTDRFYVLATEVIQVCTHTLSEAALTQARCSWNIVGDGKLSFSFSVLFTGWKVTGTSQERNQTPVGILHSPGNFQVLLHKNARNGNATISCPLVHSWQKNETDNKMRPPWSLSVLPQASPYFTSASTRSVL